MTIAFITGIDTGIGKSYVTGLWARYLKSQGMRVTTAKLVQTGSERIAEDILLHRRLMDEQVSPWDQQGLTCPYVFPYPASPHLAAAMVKETIDPAVIVDHLAQLEQHYDLILLEGAGGLRVPLTDKLTILDLIVQHNWPTLIVSSSRLGSINHTWLAVDALQANHCRLSGLAYIEDPQTGPEILNETLAVFSRNWPDLPILSIPWMLNKETVPYLDFSVLQWD